MQKTIKSAKAKLQTGLRIERKFTTPQKNPFDEVEYSKRNSRIAERDGKVVFEMKDVEIPSSWSQLATDIVVSKYFRKAGVPGTGNETSVKQLIHRVTSTIRAFGEQHDYFASAEDAESFQSELNHLLINQKAAFNSPVWFNCGLHTYGIKGSGGLFYWDFDQEKIVKSEDSYSRPQCSACFIQSIEDDMNSIFDLIKNEARLFKYGSGTGTNFSKLRSRYEKLSGGGTSSGVMSFLEVLDRGAGATKSGGTTRRAAKMVIMNIDHPEITDFINWKLNEEKKAKILIANGYPSDFNGEAYHTVSGQNSNNSVRVTDAFIDAVLSNGKWRTTMRTTGEMVHEYDAKELWNKICDAAWQCGDPGLQFDTTANAWHTCPNSGRINASNPCSEFMFIDDTSCNLASINLIKFLDSNGNFDIEGYRHACRLVLIAQEIIVDLASYPTERIAKNTHDFRALGLGYANLGTLLMVMGLPYDSEKARAVAAALTAIMTGHAYSTSAEISQALGPFKEFEKNKEQFLGVMNKHREHAYKIDVSKCPAELLAAAREDWDNAVALGERNGYRNSQTTVIAPTGTIGLMMDCDTTGVEPEFSIVKWKKLAGGGYFKIINNSIPAALQKLGYDPSQVKEMVFYAIGRGTLEGAPHISPDELRKLGFSKEQISEAEAHIAKAKGLDEFTPNINPKELIAKGLSAKQIQEAQVYIGGAQTLEGAPYLKEEHFAVFDCANRCGIGTRFIEPMGHIRMMAAVQPFLSGAISKTVNLPNEATVEEISKVYIEGWKSGLKAIALYRDGCKGSQPLSSVQSKVTEEKQEEKIKRRQKEDLPLKRSGFTVESNIGGHKMFLRTGEYPDGRLGEVFVDMHKEGAAFRSLMNCFAISISLGLQYGVPLEKFVDKFTFTRFEPNGMTDHPNIKVCTSVVDFIFRVIGYEYLKRTDFVHVKPVDAVITTHESQVEVTAQAKAKQQSLQAFEPEDQLDKQLGEMMGDAPPCNMCGHTTVRNGSCYKCLNCGNSMGCS